MKQPPSEAPPRGRTVTSYLIVNRSGEVRVWHRHPYGRQPGPDDHVFRLLVQIPMATHRLPVTGELRVSLPAEPVAEPALVLEPEPSRS